jgi:prophage antirepressor-like protein
MDLQLFSFNSQQVRIVSVNGDPWFVAQDVCNILDLGNVSQACKPLKSREKDLYNNDTLGGNQDVVIISESGLYRLTMKSRKPQAEPFQDWVCEEILPTIRKTGKYEVIPSQPAIALLLPQNFIEALESLIKSEKEKLMLTEANQLLLEEKQVLQLAIADSKPKAEFYDIYVSADGWLTGEQIAKQLSVSTRKMFDILRKEKVIYARSGRNFPCADWVDKKWATMRPVRCHDEIVRSNLVFSHKVIMQIFDLLQEDGLIEKNRNYQLHFVVDEIKPMKRA